MYITRYYTKYLQTYLIITITVDIINIIVAAAVVVVVVVVVVDVFVRNKVTAASTIAHRSHKMTTDMFYFKGEKVYLYYYKTTMTTIQIYDVIIFNKNHCMKISIFIIAQIEIG